ncbi:hypothetical protein EI94DRAFT_1789794 [Lactarius quietus]|nr:hypothetical protein EI94DRAFT_1789794 [Lactarius quietus]
MTDVRGSIYAIDSSITQFQQRLAISSQSHPLRLFSLLGLATMRFQRHLLSEQREDLDKSILHFAESMFLSPRLWSERGPLILQSFFYLASALLKRSQLSQQTQDAIFAAKYLRYLLNQPFIEVPRYLLITMLVEALDVQVNLKAGNEMQNIGEMTVLCRELITSDVSDDITNHPILLLTRAAGSIRPTRYFMTFVNDDYEEAASILDETITSRSPGDGQDEFVGGLEHLVTGIAVLRSGMHNTPEYSEEAIYRARAFLKNPSNYFFTRSLEDIEKQRFRFFGFIEGLEASSSPVPSREHKDLDLELDPLRTKTDLVARLLSGIRKNDIAKIDEAIEKGRKILSSSPPHLFALILSDSFAGVLLSAFKLTNKIDFGSSVCTAPTLPVTWSPFPGFVHPFLSSPDHPTQDADEAMELLSRCADDGHASLHDRFEFACRWASFARALRYPSVAAAYEYAMSLTQNILLFAPTLQLQHATLTTGTTSGYSRRLPLDYASYHVELNQLEEAIVTLERGRALLWSEMRHLRASIDQLLQAYPQLGHRFAVISRDLEELTKSVPPSHKLSMDDGVVDDVRAVDPFGRLLVKQRKLLMERDGLISQIRALPGFDKFLASPSFDTLRSAAASGPVVIINHSKRSDILILLHNTSPSLITTPADFFLRANALKDNHYNEALAQVLTGLYDLVGKPVIERFCQLKVPEQSRVWWCPTSVFCSLPLHAMGPIPSDEGGEDRYFLDLYIPSYTPTISALIHEYVPREPGPPTSGLPSLLLVAHFDVPSPDVPLSEVCEDVKVVQELHTRLPVKKAQKPFDAGFELHANARLTLLEIVRSRLPAAEFAFLAACHTAELTDGSSADEGLHLAAAVQYYRCSRGESGANRYRTIGDLLRRCGTL